MKNVLLRARILSVSTISACTFFGASSLLFSQSRDFNAERFILDDNAGDGTRNTLLLQVPVTGLTANRTLTLPDADGTVVTVGPGGLTANQILFGGAAGQVEQSANLLWDNTTSIFSIGGGLFTVDGTTGNTVIAGTLDQQGAVSNSTGDVVVNDDANVTGSLDVDTDLNVDGTSTLVGALDAQAAGNVIGDGTDAEQLEVQGVDGGAVEVDINGDVDVSGTLTVGTLVFTGDLDMNDNDIFDIDELRGNSTTGDLNINTTNTGDVNLGGGSGAVNVSGDLNVTGGTATFPVTAAQGDALIASTNAGTTTIDAVRIGTGLTDAQVNDDLTIDGGSVDASPIGGTTPSTGAFTTITGTTLPAASTSTDLVTSNGGALETRTAASLAGEIGVVTDATLTGDGTTGDPLGIDLANANTWTGTQTLPVTAAQGDALIASTNAGTTTVDAARIGAGLTDAQVNDNLTIDGGTVDATPIGGTTPSTGAFTTITGTTLPAASTSTDVVTSNGGALETRTAASLAGEIGVVTDATLTGDGTTGDPLGIDLANANTWTGTQTLPVTAAQGDALIASTNAGTTTVDAARIGAGLTDAQVNDNLTIDGGTVDATPIGATTPSTGAFTTITGTTLPAASTSTDVVTSNGGALETRTAASLAGEIGVVTDATLTGTGRRAILSALTWRTPTHGREHRRCRRRPLRGTR